MIDFAEQKARRGLLPEAVTGGFCKAAEFHLLFHELYRIMCRLMRLRDVTSGDVFPGSPVDGRSAVLWCFCTIHGSGFMDHSLLSVHGKACYALSISHPGGTDTSRSSSARS